MWINCGGLYLIVALNTGLQTLCSQAAGFSSDLLLGLYYQRGVLILSICMVFMSIFFLLTKPLMLAIGIEE